MKNLLHSNYLLHRKFDNLRNSGNWIQILLHWSILVGIVLAFVYFIDNENVWIIASTGITFIIVAISRYLALVSSDMYSKRKKRL